ncbi:MATE family efflux transporter [Lawsonibacter sp. LCP25S3_G6]|uniref:MATE family efflux transporter n=1 Tax=unclassified Lawsonibacter TaxID=2617946 RepID=UPI003F9837CF
MADDKLNAGTKDNTPPEAAAPAGKVIDLSSIQAATDHDGKESTAPDVTARPLEAVPDQKRRGRPPKEQAGVSAGKKEKAAEPRTGRPSKVDKAAREEAPPSVRDKVSRGKKADKGKETGSGGAPVSKSAKAVKPGKAAPVKEAAVPPPEINLPPTPDVPPRPVEEGKIVYLKMAELHPFHTFREHPYKVQDDKAMDDLVGTIKEHGITALVSTYSVTAIAAYGVTGKLETILFYPAMALNMVLTTIIGQCVGGTRYDRAKDYLKCALGYGCGLLIILSALVVGFSRQLSGLFVKSDAVAAIVGTYFLIISVGYVLNTVTNCYLGALNGMGKPSKSMFLMIFYYIVVRMPLAYLLSYLGFGLNGIWVAVLVSHVVASVAAGISATITFKKRTSTT